MVPGAGRLGMVPLLDRDKLVQAANEVADAYIHAVDEFLRTHPGATPKSEGRFGAKWGPETWSDGFREMRERQAPWCADWSKGLLELMDKELDGSVASKLIRLEQGQFQSPDYQHNFLIVRPQGIEKRLWPAAVDDRILLFDAWRTLTPNAYLPSKPPYVPSQQFK